MVANKYIREVETVFKPTGMKEKVKISSSKEAYILFHDLINSTQEKLVALHLAGDNSVVCFQIVHIGSIDEAYCNPADILRTALLTGAVSLVLLHNHPSGEVNPSPADQESVKLVKVACHIFHIHLFDWIIVGKNEFYSAADAGELK